MEQRRRSRLFKRDGLDGQAVIHRGGIPSHEDGLTRASTAR
jgi:hypothetical protein